jgi:hypothetical protein
MNIEQMQQTWSELNKKLDDQKFLNEKILMKITSEQSKNRLNKISSFEIFSIIGMVILVIYILIRFDRLDTLTSRIGGIVTVSIALIAIISSIIAIAKISRIDIQENTVAQSLKAITEVKSFFFMYQLAGWTTGPILIFSSITVFVKLLHHKDIFAQAHFYLVLPTLALLITIPLSYLIYKRFYKKNIREVESMLDELKNSGN